MEVYKQLPTVVAEHKAISKLQNVNICVGKEWHRFPSNFFLPERYIISFILSIIIALEAGNDNKLEKFYM